MPGQAWLHCFDSVPADARRALEALLAGSGIVASVPAGQCDTVGVAVFERIDAAVLEGLRSLGERAMVLGIALCAEVPRPAEMWSALQAGAADLLHWPHWAAAQPCEAAQVAARLERWRAVQALMDSEAVRGTLVGDSPAWRVFLRGVVQAAAFTRANVLVTGESGTGKELIAQLVHELDPRPDKGELVVLDCTTLTQELSGSEFFGHERGAFTGAVNAREGVFALAHRGTLFLDEVGELPLPMQAQLLRAIQEGKYKRVGSNAWQHTDFRLVCATHRDLEAAVAAGSFRADLFYRIAAWRCRPPPLRARSEDILPLAAHFFNQVHAGGAQEHGIEWDPAVREYLLLRDYPGNVRDLRQTVMRMAHRHAGPGPVTLGDVPEDEWPQSDAVPGRWPDAAMQSAVARAVELGMGLKEITQTVSDLAMQAALAREANNVQRAARRLGVTDRTVQLRRAAWRGEAGT
jgi:transcriptional regulator with GAF, ATPase, and Fis domain